MNGYFTTDANTYNVDKIIGTGLQDIILFFWQPDLMKNLTAHVDDENDHVFRQYSIVLLDDMKPVVDMFNTFIHVMVPVTSTQPEKAMIFMQWLMTDKEVADLLTFGSQLMGINHYRFSGDGTIIPEKNNTLYAFYKLIANFSDKPYICKKYDVVHDYKEKTYQALYPVLVQLMDSDNERFVKLEELSSSLRQPNNLQMQNRSGYLGKSIEELILNPYSNLDAERMKQDLDAIGNLKYYKESMKEAIEKSISYG